MTVVFVKNIKILVIYFAVCSFITNFAVNTNTNVTKKEK